MELIKDSINSGANFCQVKIKNSIIHLICLHMDGSQKWNGALPNLVNNEIIIIDENIELLNIENIEIDDIYIKIDLLINKDDLIDWIIKYFIDLSISKFLDLIFINGKIPIRFNSNPIHIINQWEDDNDIIVPIISIIMNIKLAGKNLLFIKSSTIMNCS